MACFNSVLQNGSLKLVPIKTKCLCAAHVIVDFSLAYHHGLIYGIPYDVTQITP